MEYTVTTTDSQAQLAFTYISEPTPTIVRDLVQGLATVELDSDTSTLPFTGRIICDLANLDAVKLQLQPADFV